MKEQIEKRIQDLKQELNRLSAQRSTINKRIDQVAGGIAELSRMLDVEKSKDSKELPAKPAKAKPEPKAEKA